jgi:hypothetical protein
MPSSVTKTNATHLKAEGGAMHLSSMAGGCGPGSLDRRLANSCISSRVTLSSHWSPRRIRSDVRIETKVEVENILVFPSVRSDQLQDFNPSETYQSSLVADFELYDERLKSKAARIYHREELAEV